MRTPTVFAVAAGLLWLPSVMLTAQVLVREQAPTDRAADISAADIASIIQDMADESRATTRLLEGGSFNINIRRLEGPEAALMHPNTTDVYVVRQGTGTLVTGGQMLDEDGDAIDGPRGAAIRGGTERVISAGDLVFIPAGVPHRIRETDGITWFNIRFDTR